MQISQIMASPSSKPDGRGSKGVVLMKHEVLTTSEFIAGGLAGVAQVVSAHPLDTIKTRLQLNSTYATPKQIFLKTVKEEGVLALYKGMLAPVIGVAFINAVLFASYAGLKTSFNPDHSKLTLAQIAIAGSGAGIVNSFVASPIEMLKIRLQAQRNTNASGRSGPWVLTKTIVSSFN